MEELEVSIEIDGIPCVLHREGLNSPVMVHKLAKLQRGFKAAKDGETPRIDPMDMDYIGEAIFGDEQWEAILEQVDGKGIFYTWKFIADAMAAASEKVEDVKNF